MCLREERVSAVDVQINFNNGIFTILKLLPLGPQYGALVTSCAPRAPIRRSDTTTTGPEVAVISA